MLDGLFWQEDPYNFIKPEEYEALGIDSGDIPPGTYPAYKHPSQLPSRFGGNAYGFGFYEVSERLSPKDVELLQTVSARRNRFGSREWSRRIKYCL